MERAMTAEQYRDFARECLTAAAKAKTEEEREAFLENARMYTQAALQIEGAVFVPPPAIKVGNDAR
jgi:hypothetical protein